MLTSTSIPSATGASPVSPETAGSSSFPLATSLSASAGAAPWDPRHGSGGGWRWRNEAPLLNSASASHALLWAPLVKGPRGSGSVPASPSLSGVGLLGCFPLSGEPLRLSQPARPRNRFLLASWPSRCPRQASYSAIQRVRSAGRCTHPPVSGLVSSLWRLLFWGLAALPALSRHALPALSRHALPGLPNQPSYSRGIPLELLWGPRPSCSLRLRAYIFPIVVEIFFQLVKVDLHPRRQSVLGHWAPDHLQLVDRSCQFSVAPSPVAHGLESGQAFAWLAHHLVRPSPQEGQLLADLVVCIPNDSGREVVYHIAHFDPISMRNSARLVCGGSPDGGPPVGPHLLINALQLLLLVADVFRPLLSGGWGGRENHVEWDATVHPKHALEGGHPSDVGHRGPVREHR